ncbi:SWI/SNF and RSC complexes subunit ssr4 [Podospora conica]|nr:SWI/SNF and RSC complexes subunit ssr4 [Schizothecium conicum]
MDGDPSQKVHPDLLPHVHLVSTHRYPLMQKVDLSEVANWLTKAKGVSRQTAPFFWTFLDGPQHGTIFLCWQPTATRGLEFASDGYIWDGPEIRVQQDAGNGLIIEIYYQSSGFRPNDQFSTHSRRRFRLIPGQHQAAENLSIDPNLWIVHYGPAEKAHWTPVNTIRISPQQQHMLQVRSQLFQMGQIMRKEFILSDRRNWPEIPLPARGQSIYAPPMPTRNVPQAMAYPPHPAPAVGPTPRRRGGAQGAAHPAQMAGAPPYPGMEGVLDDDEDVSRGDMFDHLTPQELSLQRYQQNHEWMEEILSSPYRIGQIEVADLGLGRRGELASLTDGVFESQGTGNWQKGPKNRYTGHLNPTMADEFRKRIEARTAAVEAEVAKMKQDHEKMLQDFRQGTAIKKAELELRTMAMETGSEVWRLEGRIDDEDEDAHRWTSQTKTVDEILAHVESIVGKKASVVHNVHRVQAGGWEEPAAPAPPPVQQQAPPKPDALGVGQSAPMSRQPSHAGSQNSGVMVGDSDIDMGGTAAGLLDQMHAGFSSTTTPQPQSSAVATPNVPSPLPTTTQAHVTTAAPTSHPLAAATAAADQEPGATGDWVVVPKTTDVSPNTTTAPAAPPATTAPSSTPGGEAAMGFDSNDFSSLGDLDTAGDALAGYDPPSVEGDLSMEMEDSAFGDALHGVGGGEGGTPANT